MSSKVTARFEQNREAGRSTLVGYFPIGYPTLQESIDAAIAMCQNGVDVLELGVPYSDPVMDGPVIQQATGDALSAGFKLRDTFAAVKAVTEAVDTPVLVMTYWNPVLQYGVERFASELKSAGGAGLITPDLIPDEAGEWLEVSDAFHLDRVFLATPTSTPHRVQRACELSRGFVYSVSTMGITGARAEVDQNARKVVSAIRNANAETFTAVGIGISTAEQVLEVNKYADGAIVGSAFVRAYQNGGLPQLIETTKQLDPNQ
ncbi:MAG: tryptophan synthase subunit alpha [Micrococcales bacterium]